MNGKLRRELDALRQDLANLHKKADSHASAEDLAKVHADVKSARTEAADAAKATQTALSGVTAKLGSVTSSIKDAFAEAARLTAAGPVAAPEPAAAPAAKKANGKTATPTAAATAAASKENS